SYGFIDFSGVPVELLKGRLCLESLKSIEVLQAEKFPMNTLYAKGPEKVRANRYLWHISNRKEDPSYRPLIAILGQLTPEHYFGAQIDEQDNSVSDIPMARNQEGETEEVSERRLEVAVKIDFTRSGIVLVNRNEIKAGVEKEIVETELGQRFKRAMLNCGIRRIELNLYGTGGTPFFGRHRPENSLIISIDVEKGEALKQFISEIIRNRGIYGLGFHLVVDELFRQGIISDDKGSVSLTDIPIIPFYEIGQAIGLRLGLNLQPSEPNNNLPVLYGEHDGTKGYLPFSLWDAIHPYTPGFASTIGGSETSGLWSDRRPDGSWYNYCFRWQPFDEKECPPDIFGISSSLTTVKGLRDILDKYYMLFEIYRADSIVPFQISGIPNSPIFQKKVWAKNIFPENVEEILARLSQLEAEGELEAEALQEAAREIFSKTMAVKEFIERLFHEAEVRGYFDNLGWGVKKSLGAKMREKIAAAISNLKQALSLPFLKEASRLMGCTQENTSKITNSEFPIIGDGSVFPAAEINNSDPVSLPASLDLYNNSLFRQQWLPLLGYAAGQVMKEKEIKSDWKPVSIEQAATSADKLFELMVFIATHFSLGAFFVPMDLTCEAEAVALANGIELKVSYEEGEAPKFAADEILFKEGRLAFNLETISSLKYPKPQEDGRLKVYLKALEAMDALEELDNRRWMKIAYITGPYTLCGELMGGDAMMAYMLDEERAAFDKLMAYCEEVVKNNAKAFIDAGADAVMILDPHASNLTFAPVEGLDNQTGFKRYCEEPINRIVSFINSKAIPVLMHTCVTKDFMLEPLSKLNVQGYSLDPNVDIRKAYDTLIPGTHKVIIGNFNTTLLFTGPEEKIQEELFNALNKMQGCQRFKVATACDIPASTPEKHIQAFCSQYIHDAVAVFNEADYLIQRAQAAFKGGLYKDAIVLSLQAVNGKNSMGLIWLRDASNWQVNTFANEHIQGRCVSLIADAQKLKYRAEDMLVDIEKYFAVIRQFRTRDFSAENFERKVRELLTYIGPSADIIHTFVVHALIDMTNSIMQGEGRHYRVLGCAGEISGIYEVVVKLGSTVEKLNFGRFTAFDKIIYRDNFSVKEFDAVSENTVFEFKFHLTLGKLYQQVIGIDSAKRPHLLELIQNPNFQGVRNLAYFGEADYGYVAKALKEFIRNRPQVASKVILTNKGLSIKLTLTEVRDFLESKPTIDLALGEQRNFSGKIGLRAFRQKARFMETLINRKIKQLKGEHFDVIIAMSNIAEKDRQDIGRIINKITAPTDAVPAVKADLKRAAIKEVRGSPYSVFLKLEGGEKTLDELMVGLEAKKETLQNDLYILVAGGVVEADASGTHYRMKTGLSRKQFIMIKALLALKYQRGQIKKNSRGNAKETIITLLWGITELPVSKARASIFQRTPPDGMISRPPDSYERDGRIMLGELLVDPDKFNEMKKNKVLPDLKWVWLGKTDGSGEIPLPVKKNYPYRWKGLGLSDEGWSAFITDCEIRRGIYEINVQFTKEGHSAINKIFQIGPTRKILMGNNKEKGKRITVLDIDDSPGRRIIGELIYPLVKSFKESDSGVPDLTGLRLGTTNSDGGIFIVPKENFFFYWYPLDLPPEAGWSGVILSSSLKGEIFEFTVEFTKALREPVRRTFQIGHFTRRLNGRGKQKGRHITVRDISARFGMKVISDLVARPINSKWKQDEIPPDIAGLRIGVTNRMGCIRFNPIGGHRYTWYPLGFREAGWEVIGRKRKIVNGCYVFTADFIKDGRVKMQKTFQIGPYTTLLVAEQNNIGQNPVSVLKILEIGKVRRLAAKEDFINRVKTGVVDRKLVQVTGDEDLYREFASRDIWEQIGAVLESLNPQEVSIADMILEGKAGNEIILKCKCSAGTIHMIKEKFRKSLAAVEDSLEMFGVFIKQPQALSASSGTVSPVAAAPAVGKEPQSGFSMPKLVGAMGIFTLTAIVVSLGIYFWLQVGGLWANPVSVDLAGLLTAGMFFCGVAVSSVNSDTADHNRSGEPLSEEQARKKLVLQKLFAETVLELEKIGITVEVDILKMSSEGHLGTAFEGIRYKGVAYMNPYSPLRNVCFTFVDYFAEKMYACPEVTNLVVFLKKWKDGIAVDFYKALDDFKEYSGEISKYKKVMRVLVEFVEDFVSHVNYLRYERRLPPIDYRSEVTLADAAPTAGNRAATPTLGDRVTVVASSNNKYMGGHITLGPAKAKTLEITYGGATHSVVLRIVPKGSVKGYGQGRLIRLDTDDRRLVIEVESRKFRKGTPLYHEVGELIAYAIKWIFDSKLAHKEADSLAAK
ncbi:MAG: hypothetical protein NTW13_03290, partial [Candidatus Omnitrophica bacterium]|nr:hypothetical protein [Candidatus Omnitrophota bacterium]